MDAVESDIATDLKTRLDVIETTERSDPSRRALSRAELAVFLGVTLAVTALGILVLAL